jgi:uncharacterized repeat protein (TIGR02543 family)
VSFLGWYTEGVGGSEFDFDGAVVDSMTLYAHYSDEFLVQFLDGYGSVFLTKHVPAGSAISIPSSDELNTFSYLTEYIFENQWNLDGDLYDFFRPVMSDIVLTPVLYDTVWVYFISYGSPVGPMFVKKGATIADLGILSAPTRAGYSFSFWTDTEYGTTPINPATIIDTDLVLYAQWTAMPNAVQYKVVYWVEKPNLGHEPVPGNMDDYNIGYD